jgi:hypothetical protein
MSQNYVPDVAAVAALHSTQLEQTQEILEGCLARGASGSALLLGLDPKP